MRVLHQGLLLLMGVGLIHFSTALLGRYPQEPISIIAYGINGLVVSLLYNSLWFYPRHRRLAHEEPHPEIITHRSMIVIVGPTVLCVSDHFCLHIGLHKLGVVRFHHYFLYSIWRKICSLVAQRRSSDLFPPSGGNVITHIYGPSKK